MRLGLITEMETNAQYFDCLCRTCMNKVEASTHYGTTKPQLQWLSIFDLIVEYGQLRIAELLSDAVPQIVVQLSDELPKKICTECLQRLLSVYRFQQMCVQSDKQMHEVLSKEHIILKPPILKEAIKGETERNDADSEPLKDLPCSSTLQNLQQPSIQEPLAEVTVPTIELDAAQLSADDHMQNNILLLEQCVEAKDESEECIIRNEPIEDDETNSEYSDDDTMHSTICVPKNEPIELEDEQVNVTSSRHKCHLCNKSYKRRQYLTKHLNDHKMKAKNRKEYCYACHLCSESYKKQQYLSRHLSIEHPNRSSHTQKSKEKLHKCDVCKKRFTRTYQLKVHKRKHTGEKPYTCKYCERAFTSCTALTKHLHYHLGDNIYKCKFCPSAFPSESEMLLHLTTHENEDLETRERNLKALQEEEAKLELKLSKEGAERQSKEEQQQQKLSNKELEQPSIVRGEFTEFIQNEPIEDDKSNTECSDDDTMHSTISVTKDEAEPVEPEDQQVNVARDKSNVFVINEPIQDDNPNTESSDGDTMHSAMHVMKDEPNTEPEDEQINDASSHRHVCQLCNKSFNLLRDLNEHLNMHKTKEDSHVCHLCGLPYKGKKGSLARHLREKHSIESKGYTCDFCNKSFTAPAFLRRHIRTHTGERPYSCSDCGKSFNQEGILAQHRNSRYCNMGYECPYCARRCSSQSGLKRHKVTHEEHKKLKCNICGKRFKMECDLRQHILYHRVGKPYKCDFCAKEFVFVQNLQIHLRSHTGENPQKDSETRERNQQDLQEEKAELELMLSKEKAEEQQLSNKEIEQPSIE